MGERIKRADVARMVKDWRGGELGQPYPILSSRQQSRYCYCNLGNYDVNVGDLVTITGLWQDTLYDSTPVLPQDKFIDAFLSNNIIFTGRSRSISGSIGLLAVAEEPIGKKGGVGYIHLMKDTEIFLAKYKCEDGGEVKRLDLDSLSFKISSLGEYKVIVTSEEDESHNVYALIYYSPMNGTFPGKYYMNGCSKTGCQYASGSTEHIHLDDFPDVVIDESYCVLPPHIGASNDTGYAIKVLVTRNQHIGKWIVEDVYTGVLFGVIKTITNNDYGGTFTVETGIGIVTASCPLYSPTCEFHIKVGQKVALARQNSGTPEWDSRTNTWGFPYAKTWAIIGVSCSPDEEEENE